MRHGIPGLMTITCAAVLMLCDPVNGQSANTPSLFDPPMARKDLDPAVFAQWVDGAESPLSSNDKPTHPSRLISTRDSQQEWNGVSSFGDGKSLGPRHLRVGFVKELAVGSILANGNCRVSVLKPESKYPGDMGDDSQWLPAERVSGDTVTSLGDGCLLWTLPPNTQTRAIRFTHTPKETDKSFAGSVGGARLLGARLANIAPQARVTASTNENKADVITNERLDGWRSWDNWNDTNPPKPVEEQTPWVMLAWREPVTISGLAALFGGFGAAEVLTYAGPADRNPAEASDSDWKLVRAFDKLSSWYPLQLPVQWMDFGQTITTRAIRLRMTKVAPEGHPHLKGNTKDGRRVWLDELLVLHPLGAEPLASVIPRKVKEEAIHPPIPVRFKLKAPSLVTIVIDDAQGRRVRNLVSETPFPAGGNVAWWDGMDDVGRDAEAARHGLYHVPGAFVAPGTYKVRGLYRKDIDLLYEFPIYTAGDPAWNTSDKTGAWLSNHTPPCCALFVPANRSPNGKDLVYIGSHISEGTHGLAWVDLEGRKAGGVTWVGGNWTGAQELALDTGADADKKIILYVGSTFEGELRLTALTNSGDKPVFKMGGSQDGKKKDKDKEKENSLSGLAVRNGLLVCSLSNSNKLLFVDAASGKMIGESQLAEPKGLAFDAEGRLLAISGRQVLRFALGTKPSPGDLPKAEVVVEKGLDDPMRLAVDATGTLFVSDRGASHQVKVFSKDGKPLRSIGKAGTPKAGPYDPLRMNNPAGLTVDSQGRLWVTEQDEQPKRVSVWKASGELVKAFYGPAEYGGGGALDPLDKTLFYYKGMMFKLDWEKGTNTLTSVFWRPGPEDGQLPDGHFAGGSPQLPIYTGGKKYFTNCYNSNPTNGALIATVWIEKDGLARPAAAVGRANSWSLMKSEPFLATWPQGIDPNNKDPQKSLAFCAWSDLNDDGRPQPGEVKMVKGESGGITIMPDLSAVASRLEGKTTRLTPVKFSPGGVPIYDIDAGEVLAVDVQGPATSGGDQALAHPDGWTVLTAVPKPYSRLSVAGVFKGEPRWSYPSPWPGLHASHEAQAPDRPGMLIGTTRLLGGFITPRNSDAGPIWCVNGNMGPMYLMTADGLFVATLFKDVRQGVSWSMPKAQRGMNLNEISPHDENFWPSITQTKDGEVYIVDGARTSLVHATGLETIKRLPDGEITVGVDDLKKARDYFTIQEAARQAALGRKTLRVASPPSPPTIDGKLDEWDSAEWVSVDKRGTAANFNSDSKPYDVQAAVAVSGDRLSVAYRTADKNLLRNSGETPNALFKTGGALDLMIGSASADARRKTTAPGDMRLLVTQVKGKTAALLYKPVVPGTPEKDRVPFSSPWRTIHFDKVEDVSDSVRLAGANGDYEISVPLALLGLKPGEERKIKADIGILRGDGFQTLQRVYWSNKATGITADVPSEAELIPSLWGEWEFPTQSNPATKQ